MTIIGKNLIYGLILFLLSCCTVRQDKNYLLPHQPFIEQITKPDLGFYSVVMPPEGEKRNELAIGVFDSGIGGLTVFEAIATADFFDAGGNKQPDGISDFAGEQFIYLADNANMPYSNYVETGKTTLLEEHILKAALFLINNRFHPSAWVEAEYSTKPQVKAIVIACNTATAYGKPHIGELCKRAGLEIKIIGVIDAGCRGALEVIGSEGATVAVFATPATVASGAYVEALQKMSGNQAHRLSLVQQGGKGLHEAIENKPGFITATDSSYYPAYQGPSLWNENHTIVRELLPYYNFDTTANRMLYNHPSLLLADTIAINSVENYVRYHMVSMLEQLLANDITQPLKAIILACTHYPLVAGTIHEVLDELRQTGRYGRLFYGDCHLVDPALNTARELYSWFLEQGLFNKAGKNRMDESLFFVTVPNIFEPGVEVSPEGRFTYDYQYQKREAGEMKDYTLIVPFADDNISQEQKNLIRSTLPFTTELLNKTLKIK